MRGYRAQLSERQKKSRGGGGKKFIKDQKGGDDGGGGGEMHRGKRKKKSFLKAGPSCQRWSIPGGRQCGLDEGGL